LRKHHRLHRRRAFDCIDDREELDQQAISSRLDDATGVPRHQSVDDDAVLAQNASGARFVKPHQPRISHDVGGQYRRQPAFDPAGPFFSHGLHIL